ncbi:MAG: OmpW family outer membrane protein [Flavobacteriaceae bacterium]|nr:OmpW family outer membrane protein [Flavobacteriaceae bacterium]
MRTILKSILLFLVVFSTGTVLAQDEDVKSNDFNPWQFRLRGIVITPDESANIEAIGGTADISSTFVPELDITYFFSERFAAELILATNNHDVAAVGTAAGDVDLGDVWLLPPTLTFQYHHTDWGKFKPYVGAGINYTIFYGEDEGPVADDVSYDNAFGFALQLGFDIKIDDNWFINADLKKLFLNTDVTVNTTTALGATVNADVDIDPWIFGIGIGYKL